MCRSRPPLPVGRAVHGERNDVPVRPVGLQLGSGHDGRRGVSQSVDQTREPGAPSPSVESKLDDPGLFAEQNERMHAARADGQLPEAMLRHPVPDPAASTRPPHLDRTFPLVKGARFESERPDCLRAGTCLNVTRWMVCNSQRRYSSRRHDVTIDRAGQHQDPAVQQMRVPDVELTIAPMRARPSIVSVCVCSGPEGESSMRRIRSNPFAVAAICVSLVAGSSAAQASQSIATASSSISPWAALSALGTQASKASLCSGASVAAAQVAGAAAAAAQAAPARPGCVLPVVDAAPPVVQPETAPVFQPVADGGGLGVSPLLLGLGALALGGLIYLILNNDDDDDDVDVPVSPA